jgi:hypothetical protein
MIAIEEGELLMSMHTDGSEESKIRQTDPSIMDRWFNESICINEFRYMNIHLYVCMYVCMYEYVCINI